MEEYPHVYHEKHLVEHPGRKLQGLSLRLVINRSLKKLTRIWNSKGSHRHRSSHLHKSLVQLRYDYQQVYHRCDKFNKTHPSLRPRIGHTVPERR